MDWELVYYLTSLSISIVLSLGVARYAWRRRSIPGAEYFALFMLGAVLWAFGTLLTLVSANELFLILANAVAAIGIVVMPIAWLAFTLEYTGRGKWLTNRTWTLITVPPIIGMLLLFGTGYLAPIQQGRELDVGSPGLLFIIGFLVAGVSISLLLLTGTLFIIRALIQAPKMYRRQYYSLLIGVWCPWFFGLLSLGGQDQSALGLLPLGAAIGGLVATWGFFRYQVFDVMPIALDTVIESISDGVIVLDTQHRIVDLNPAAQSMTRLSAEQGAGLPITQALSDWKEFLHCLDQAQTQAEITLQEPVRSDTVVKGKDGGYFELRISPLYDRREALSGRLVLLHDISARVQAEEALERRAAQLATLNRIENQVSAILNQEDLLQYVVDAVRDDLGYPRAAVLLMDVDEPQVSTRLQPSPVESSTEPLNDKETSELTVAAATDDFWEIIPDNYRQPVGMGAIGIAAETGETVLVSDASGDRRVYQVGTWLSPSSLSAPIEMGGRVIGVLEVEADAPDAFDENDVMVMNTLASQVAVALENARLYEALRESEETLQLAMEGANVGFWHQNLAIDDASIIIQDRTEVVGYIQTTDETTDQMVHPDDRSMLMEAWDACASGTAPLIDVEYRNRTRPGEWAWIRVRGRVVVHDEDGKPLRIAGIYQDVTARVQAEEELREAQTAAERSAQAAEDANRAKSEFLANMSHELRTPLNAILGFSQLMTRDSSLTAEQQENLETIGRSGEHLLGLINDVLELSKIEAGRVALQEESLDLHRLLDGLEEMFHLRAMEKGLMLIFDQAPDVPQYVRTDEGKLRQVLMNLLGNAVKFTREGGVTLRVGTKDQGPLQETKDRPSSLLFEVEDTGPGIAPEELDAVFDPFTQTASGQKSHEGTGLGMPISRQFVRLMGGDLTVRSELGVGSLFKFDVQVELADAADVPTAQPTRRVIGLEPDQRAADGGPYRLLVVEDREANRRLLVKLLAPLGFEMQEAVNGQEGIEVWQLWKPHLIWMDMRMPVMDGHEAAQRIKATTQGQATVIVALTASAFESDRAVILSGGCDDYVRKPFREEEIFDTLAKHLGARFVYEERAQPTGVTAEAAEGLLSTAALAALPADWVTSLHQAATQLDADLILALCDRIREQNAPRADALESLVHDFRFDVILNLTAPTEDGNE